MRFLRILLLACVLTGLSSGIADSSFNEGLAVFFGTTAATLVLYVFAKAMREAKD